MKSCNGSKGCNLKSCNYSNGCNFSSFPFTPIYIYIYIYIIPNRMINTISVLDRVNLLYICPKLVGIGSSTSSSRIDEQLRQIQENTQKYENRLSISIEDWEQYIKNWEMSKQNIKELYKVGNFEFKIDYRIEIS